MFSELIDKTPDGQKVLQALSADTRVQGLVNTMISKGSSAARFEIKDLAMWFLWASNEFGPKSAEKNLNLFLDSAEIEVICTLWVLGIETTTTLDLGEGYQIVPVSEMPLSSDSEYYMQHERYRSGRMDAKPKAALTKIVKIRKTWTDEPLPDAEPKTEFWLAHQRLSELALLLNAISGVSCVAFYQTAYFQKDMPMGTFGGSGGGAPIHDIYGLGSTPITQGLTSEIGKLHQSFQKLNKKEKQRVSMALSRLSQAKRRFNIPDKILDLCIALEMLLLADNKSHEQLALSFRLRGSWLIATNHDERKNVYGLLKSIYTFRSQVAHSGALKREADIKHIREFFPEYAGITERIIQTCILTPTPDWTNIILGIAL